MSSPQWKSPVQDGAILPERRSYSFSSGGDNTNNSRAGAATGLRETGIVEKLMHSYGFIECCDRQARLFFHYSQFTGDVEHLKIGDPVEFEMTFDRKTGKPIATAVVKISPTIVSYDLVRDERVSGTVTTELKSPKAESCNGSSGGSLGRISYENRGECFFLPYAAEDLDSPTDLLKAGDRVTFLVVSDKSSGAYSARHVRLENVTQTQRHQGVISSLRETFGFIERSDVVKEIFFHVSEAKCFHELCLGDDVEFNIQTRNGKEVGVNITQLPEGAVVFEDVGIDRFKGEVVRAIERQPPQSGGNGSGRRSSDPLPGRIRYRRTTGGGDLVGVDLEVPFGDKDLLVDFTVSARDWVQFNLATDRRDCMQRATNIEVLLEESLQVSGEQRETGQVVALKEGFGFIRCQDREARMFFHFSELIDPSVDLQIQDEVEFTVVQDASSSGRQNAIRIRSLPRGSVKFETISKELITGIVQREPACAFSSGRSPSKGGKEENGHGKTGKNSLELGLIAYEEERQKHAVISYQAADCDPRNAPKVGDKVQFHICENRSNGTRVALEIKVLGRGIKNGFKYTHRGYVAALKDGFGFIETADHDKEVFFHFSVLDGDAAQLELGNEVEYAVAQKNSKVSAESVRRLPDGSISPDVIREDVLEGIVVRPIRCFNPEQDDYSGLIRVGSEADADDAESYEFGITSLNEKREFLQKGDPVQFKVGVTPSTGKERAVKVMAMRKKLQATVESIKGQFGFLSHEVEDNKKLFFHMTEVKDAAVLQPGDTVEFVIIHNQRNGRYSACNVVRVNTGATVADTRPRHMIDRFRTTSLVDEGGPRLVVIRQPKGPDGTTGFKQPRETLVKTERPSVPITILKADAAAFVQSVPTVVRGGASPPPVADPTTTDLPAVSTDAVETESPAPPSVVAT